MLKFVLDLKHLEEKKQKQKKRKSVWVEEFFLRHHMVFVSMQHLFVDRKEVDFRTVEKSDCVNKSKL